ncbi:HI1506-related protein [Methylobacter tundripaludum]|uniref:HI1506-related protein n=1 Tax=Methylobacter tundripaludum TaxID=173365 RepID=UPI0005649574|nr:HI1506-related protein [Methylobacter tundripaludum]
MLRITSKREGFRRCGIAHSSTPTEHPDDRFTADELERLLDEPMLFVEVLADKPGKAATAKEKQADK